MCEREYPENSLFRRCFQCDYDLCAACWCVAKRPGDKETEDEAPPPPPPPGKPRSRRAREVKDDDDESPPPPPPGKPPRSVRSSRNKAKDEAEGRTTEPRGFISCYHLSLGFMGLSEVQWCQRSALEGVWTSV